MRRNNAAGSKSGRTPAGAAKSPTGPRRAKPAATDTPAAGGTLSWEHRLRLREDFFQKHGFDPRQFLQALEEIPGLFYFVKDAQSRTMLNTREYAPRVGFRTEEEVVGRRAGEYLPKDLADHYEADDKQVLRTGKRLKNIIEIGFDEQGVPDWIITHKYPLCDASGNVVGIMGTMQSFEGRLRTLPHLGKVGAAADFIRETLGESVHLSDIADHVGISERQLQRLFHQSIGMSIQKFVIHSRTHAAAQLLTHSECPMSQIALDCGFNDQSALTNTFRKVIGMTPSEYRSRYLSGHGK